MSNDRCECGQLMPSGKVAESRNHRAGTGSTTYEQLAALSLPGSEVGSWPFVLRAEETANPELLPIDHLAIAGRAPPFQVDKAVSSQQADPFHVEAMKQESDVVRQVRNSSGT